MSGNSVEPVATGGGPVVLERLATWIERRAAFLICGFAVAYFVVTGMIASRKPLGNDELFTYYFTRVPGLGDLWRALESGAEQTPPVSYMLTRGSFGLLGTGNLPIRVPQLLAFFVFCVCSYAFVARRSNRLYGLIAMLVPTVTGAYFYAFEARSYALVLAFASIALVSWQLATEGIRRRLALLGLAGGLALATASNYYAVLLLVPFGLGELVRTWERRRIDPPVWAAFAGVLVPLLAFVQLIRASHGYSSHFWGHASWKSPANFYSFLLGTRLTGDLIDRDVAIFTIVLLLVALFVLVPGRRSLPRGAPLGALCLGIAVLPLVGLGITGLAGAITLHKRELALVCLLVALAGYIAVRARSGAALGEGPPSHEVAALAGFLLIPLAAVVVAKLVTNAYVPRYALPATIGFATILPLALYRLEGRRSGVGLLVLGTLVTALVVLVGWDLRWASRTNAARQETYRFLEQHAGGNLPILVEHPHDYLELSYSPPGGLAPRLIYLADPQASLRAFGSDTAERGLLELHRLAPLRVYEYGGYVSHHRVFLALSTTRASGWHWALRRLRADRRTIRLEASDGDRALYRVGR